MPNISRLKFLSALLIAVVLQPIIGLYSPILALNGDINFGTSDFRNQDIAVIGNNGDDLGKLVENAGDLNGDNIDDFLVSAPGKDDTATYTYTDDSGIDIDTTDYEVPVVEKTRDYVVDNTAFHNYSFGALTGLTDSAMVIVVNSNNPGNVDSITFNGQQFTLACRATATNNYKSETWYLTGHSTGTHDITMTSTIGNDLVDSLVTVIQVSGVDQTDPIAASACNTGENAFTGNPKSTNPSVNINSSADQLILGGIGTYSSGTFLGNGPFGVTRVGFSTVHDNVANRVGELNSSDTVGTTFGFSHNMSWPWGLSAVSLRPSIEIPVGQSQFTGVYGTPTIVSSYTQENNFVTSFTGNYYGLNTSELSNPAIVWLVNYKSENAYSINSAQYDFGGTNYNAQLVCNHFDSSTNYGTAVYLAPFAEQYRNISNGSYVQMQGSFNGLVEVVFNTSYLLEHVNQSTNVITGDDCLSGNNDFSISMPVSTSDNSLVLSSILSDYDGTTGSSGSGSIGSGWNSFYVDPGEDTSWVYVDLEWTTDSYGSEGELYLESPSGTVEPLMQGNEFGNNVSNYTANLSTSAFSGESSDGTWILWIEDSYGDGGHEATNVSVTFNGGNSYNLPDSPSQYDWSDSTLNWSGGGSSGGSSGSGGSGSGGPNTIYGSGLTIDDSFDTGNGGYYIATGHKSPGGASTSADWSMDESYPWVGSVVSIKGAYNVNNPLTEVNTNSNDLIIGGGASIGEHAYSSPQTGVTLGKTNSDDSPREITSYGAQATGTTGTRNFGWSTGKNARWTIGAVSLIPSGGSTPTIFNERNVISNEDPTTYLSAFGSTNGTSSDKTIVTIVN